MREWLHPGSYIEETPWRPTPIRPADPAWLVISPRRIPAYVEASIRHGLQWVVFEPNAEPLWADVRQQAEDFLAVAVARGPPEGRPPGARLFVKCDRSTMTQDDIDNGRLVALIGVATVRPAEFVIIRIGMWTADDPDDDSDDD